MERFLNYMQNHRKTALVAFVLIAVPVIILVLRAFAPSVSQPRVPGVTVPTPLVQEPFTIASTTPRANETGVFPGEIVISFSTSSPIVSRDSFSYEIAPPLQYGSEVVSSLPTRTIQIQVLGRMQGNTRYTVTITNQQGETVHSWSFTTSGEVPESASRYINRRDENIIASDFPLALDLPYISNSVTMDYSNALELTATIKSGTQEAAREEINRWIRSKGIDPSTHRIVFTR
jgi:hypothetical protein